ncbi:glycosyltransferase family 2 protein [Mycetohabitans rhizoxinica]|uniref:glycosyltransferase family 2 protein n=1 Tax=Mycetohabitans rhizoxinica TaxID=412963 RepID=UPI0030D3E9DF
MDSPHPENRITVIVLTYRRRDELARTLTHLTALPERVPIIVVDNDSRDGTAQWVAQRFAHVTLIQAPGNLGAAGRNLGAAAARTRYIAFCDDDTWWEPGSLSLAADLLDAYPQVGSLTARVLVGPQRCEDPVCELMRTSPIVPPCALPGPPILGLLAGATAFRTDAFLAAGGYHPRLFIGGEEAVLALDLASAGWSLVYVPQLTVCHYPSPVRDAGRRRSLLARNAVWAAWLRLPAGAALQRTLQLAPRVWREGGGVTGWWQTLRGLRWVFSERRVIPPHVDQMRRCVEAAAARE